MFNLIWIWTHSNIFPAYDWFSPVIAIIISIVIPLMVTSVIKVYANRHNRIVPTKKLVSIFFMLLIMCWLVYAVCIDTSLYFKWRTSRDPASALGTVFVMGGSIIYMALLVPLVIKIIRTIKKLFKQNDNSVKE